MRFTKLGAVEVTLLKRLNNFLLVLPDIYCSLWVQFGTGYRNMRRQVRAVPMGVHKITFTRVP